MNGETWTQEETRRALALRNQGWNYARIGRSLGRTAPAVRARLGREGYEVVTAKTTRRPCLCCGKDFNSAGAHNRLCSGCRSRPDPGDAMRYA